MKVQKSKLILCAVAILCLGTSGVRADDEQKKSSQTTGAGQTSQSQTQYGRQSTTGAPTKINKASDLIGMEVRNQNREDLGTIKDVVVDLTSGRVSYVVLDSGGVFRDKLFAVPINAFQPSTDQEHLILNADKSKMETAQGLDKNVWPSVSNPQFGAERFWQENPSSTTQPGINTTPGSSTQPQYRPGTTPGTSPSTSPGTTPGSSPTRPGVSPTSPSPTR